MRKYIACLALVESAIGFGSYFLGVMVRFSGDLAAADHLVGNLLPRSAAFTLVLMVALVSAGLYRSRQRVLLVGIILRLGAAVIAAGLADATVYYLFPSVETGRGAQALALGAALVGLAIARLAFYRIVDSRLFKRKILIYGHGSAAASLARQCAEIGRRSFEIAGFVIAAGEQSRAECTPLLVSSTPLLELARQHHIDEVVVAMDNRRESFPTRDLLDCRMAGLKVSESATFLEREGGKIDVGVLQPSWLIFGNGFRQGTLDRIVKRTFDVSASLVLLMVTLPIWTMAAAAIYIESKGKGSVFLRQSRVGLHGQLFSMLKLRSMILEAESDGRARWASAADPRITRVGAIIRRFRIDELPQIVNILKGEMSFVGPRPERPQFVETLRHQIPFYQERHCIKPGLAGWAQLCYPYASSIDDARQKLYYDLFYVKNHGPIFDLLILVQTLEVVIWGRSRSVESPPAATPADTSPQRVKTKVAGL